jgi:DNA-binding winged helix-turn-helix (wHTH) protein
MHLTLVETNERGQAQINDDPPAPEYPPSRAAEGAALEFGRFRVLLRQRRLLAGGEPVELGTRAFDVLMVLLEADGALVTKDQLLTRAWPGIVVVPDNLKVQICELRRALGEDRDFIRTEFGRGYRFTAAVRRVSVAGSEGSPVAEVTEAPDRSNAALPAQLSAIAAQLACLEGKLAEALRLLNERSLHDVDRPRRHGHWLGFPDHVKRRSRLGNGTNDGGAIRFSRNG